MGYIQHKSDTNEMLFWFFFSDITSIMQVKEEEKAKKHIKRTQFHKMSI